MANTKMWQVIDAEVDLILSNRKTRLVCAVEEVRKLTVVDGVKLPEGSTFGRTNTPVTAVRVFVDGAGWDATEVLTADGWVSVDEDELHINDKDG